MALGKRHSAIQRISPWIKYDEKKISTWSGWPLRWYKRPPALSPPQRLPLGISIKIAPVTRVSRSPLCETMRKTKRLRRMLGHTRFCKKNTPWRHFSFFRALRPCDQDSPISVWKPVYLFRAFVYHEWWAMEGDSTPDSFVYCKGKHTCLGKKAL